MSFNVKVISTLNDKNAHEFSMFCDLCVMRMVRFRLKSFSCFQCFCAMSDVHNMVCICLLRQLRLSDPVLADHRTGEHEWGLDSLQAFLAVSVSFRGTCCSCRGQSPRASCTYWSTEVTPTNGSYKVAILYLGINLKDLLIEIRLHREIVVDIVYTIKQNNFPLFFCENCSLTMGLFFQSMPSYTWR